MSFWNEPAGGGLGFWIWAAITLICPPIGFTFAFFYGIYVLISLFLMNREEKKNASDD